MIDLVNSTRADHIVTVEDPIEFMHVHKKSIVNQREVGHDTHSFNNALKHVLRQDPDVILIGELRDLETISVALTAAETGHLVFATLHTQDAPQTIDRVIDVFPPHQQDQVRAQLAGTLQGVVCQTLVKRANGRGRVVATEVLMMTPAIANLIREGKTYQIASMMQAGRDSGMHTMDQHLADLVNAGTITRKAALEKAHDVEGINRLIQRVESPTEASARAIAASGPDFGDSYSGTVRLIVRTTHRVRVQGPRRRRARSSRAGWMRRASPPSPSRLRTMGLSPDRRSRRRRRARGSTARSTSASARGVKLKDLAIMSRQMATMIGAGLSLLRTLNILAEQTENKKLATIMARRARRGGDRRLDLRRDAEARRRLPAAHDQHGQGRRDRRLPRQLAGVGRRRTSRRRSSSAARSSRR